jgi:hypothetical protein
MRLVRIGALLAEKAALKPEVARLEIAATKRALWVLAETVVEALTVAVAVAVVTTAVVAAQSMAVAVVHRLLTQPLQQR